MLPKLYEHDGGDAGLLAPAQRRRQILRESRDWVSWTLTERQLCDIELLMTGAFAPLDGFLCQADYAGVVEAMRLKNGSLWPLPIVLDVPVRFAKELELGKPLALRDGEGILIAVLHVEDVWRPDKDHEALGVYGTTNKEHSGVFALYRKTHPYYVGGALEGVHLPQHYDFNHLRLLPAEVRERLNGQPTIAFQTRNPMHRAHKELVELAAQALNARVLIHPVVGQTKPGDVDYFTRVRCYQAILQHFEAKVDLALIPLAMRMAGPREALFHALVRKNYGCTHFIVGRDHAGPGADARGTPFYEPYEAQELLAAHQRELGVTMVPFEEIVYVEEKQGYLPRTQVPPGMDVASLSGSQVRRLLRSGEEIPSWFSYPEVIKELRKVYRPPAEQGLTLFFTGLSGAGKSTIAKALCARMQQIGDRPVTLLDGDHARQMLSSELGFSREHRLLNLRRIGYVAAEITRNGGAAVCAPIAPYADIRRELRESISTTGAFVLVFVDTPLDECERRDRKGLYAKARAGLIDDFTGVTSPYEVPEDADLVVNTMALNPEQCVDAVVAHLVQQGYLEESRDI